MIKIFYCTVAFFVVLFGSIFEYPEPVVVSCFTLFLSAYYIWLCKNSYIKFIISSVLFYCNWSIIYVNYFHEIDSMFTVLSKTEIGNEGVYILLLFVASLVLFTKNTVCEFNLAIFQEKYPEEAFSKWLLAALCVALVFIFIFGFGRPEVSGDRGSPSAIYEYSILLFIACFWYSRRTSTDIIIVFLLLLFCFQNFYFGGRITGLQLLMVLFFMRYRRVISIKKIFAYALPVFLLMTLIGKYRTELVNLDFYEVYVDLINKGMSLDTAYSSYHTSLTFLIYEGMLSVGDRLFMFFEWIVYVFLGSIWYEGKNLAVLTREVEFHYFGGILPFHFHFYLGYFGVVLCGAYVAFILNYIDKNIKNNAISYFIGIYVVTTVWRWYLYSPSQITRGLFILVIFFGVIKVALNFCNGRFFLKR